MKIVFSTLLVLLLVAVSGCSDTANRNARTTKDNKKTTPSTDAPDTTVIVTPQEPIATPPGAPTQSATTATKQSANTTDGTLPEGVKEKPADELPKVDDQSKQQKNADEQKKEGS